MNQAKSTLIIILILSTIHVVFCTEYITPTTKIDSLKNLLEIVECDEQFYILLELTERTRYVDADLAESYMLEAKAYINERVINQELFDYYKILGGVKLSKNQWEEGIAFGEKALQLRFDSLDYGDHIRIYETVGTAYSYLGQNTTAQEYLFGGLAIADSLELDTLKASIYNTIAVVYHSMKDTTMMEKYLLLAIDQGEKVDKTPVVLMARGNLAIIYTGQEKYDKAEKLILENIKEMEDFGGGSALGSNYNNLGALYNDQKKYKQALEYLEKGLEVAEYYKQPSSIALGYLNIGIANLELHNYDLAKAKIKTGLSKAMELENKPYHLYGLSCASEVHERIGEYKEALKYYKSYTELNDSLLNESRINAVADLQAKYESEKKEKEILKLSSEKESAEKREKKLIQTILLLCFGLLGLGSLFYFLRQNLLKNSIIQNKTLKIASDKIEILEKGKEIIALESLIKGQENERERLAKEMHDGLGGLLAISHSKLAKLDTPEIKANAIIKEARELIGNAYDQVRQISHNLMPLDLEKFGLVEALSNMIQRINQQNDILIDFRTYHFDLLLNNELGLNIYRISQEALANILKSAKAKNVLIELFQHEDMISLSIEDDGIGFDVNAKNAGIGISNMRNRAELLNGEFSIESKIPDGTSIFVLVPNLDNELLPNSTVQNMSANYNLNTA